MAVWYMYRYLYVLVHFNKTVMFGSISHSPQDTALGRPSSQANNSMGYTEEVAREALRHSTFNTPATAGNRTQNLTVLLKLPVHLNTGTFTTLQSAQIAEWYMYRYLNVPVISTKP